MWTAKAVKRPPQQPAQPQYANYWAPLMRKRHILPHAAQPRYTNHWAPRTRQRHQQEHRPQRPTESSDPTQHAEGRTGDCPGPVKKQEPDGMSRWGFARGQFRGENFVFSLVPKFPPKNLFAQFGVLPAPRASALGATPERMGVLSRCCGQSVCSSRPFVLLTWE